MKALTAPATPDAIIEAVTAGEVKLTAAVIREARGRKPALRQVLTYSPQQSAPELLQAMQPLQRVDALLAATVSLPPAVQEQFAVRIIENLTQTTNVAIAQAQTPPPAGIQPARFEAARQLLDRARAFLSRRDYHAGVRCARYVEKLPRAVAQQLGQLGISAQDPCQLAAALVGTAADKPDVAANVEQLGRLGAYLLATQREFAVQMGHQAVGV
jgi:hypothetical protein